MFRTKNAGCISAALSVALLSCATDSPQIVPTPATANGPTNDRVATAVNGDSSFATPTAGDAPTGAASLGGDAVAPGDTAPDASPALLDGEIDPVGVWWTEVSTPGSEVLPWLGNLTGADIRFVMRVEVTGAAPNHEIEFQFCELQTEWTDPADPYNITTIGFRPDTVATFTETTAVDLGGLVAGDSVPLPSVTFRGGIDEAGMAFDENEDGNPAVTAWVQTLLGLQIEVYEHITISAGLTLTAPDANTLEGTVDFKADALILSSNNPIIFADTVVTITPDSTSVPLTVKRLPEGGDCSELPSTIMFTPVPPAPPALIPPAPDPAAPATEAVETPAADPVP